MTPQLRPPTLYHFPTLYQMYAWYSAWHSKKLLLTALRLALRKMHHEDDDNHPISLHRTAVC